MDSGSKSVYQSKAIPFNVLTNCFTIRSPSVPTLLHISMKRARCCLGLPFPSNCRNLGSGKSLRNKMCPLGWMEFKTSSFNRQNMRLKTTTTVTLLRPYWRGRTCQRLKLSLPKLLSCQLWQQAQNYKDWIFIDWFEWIGYNLYKYKDPLILSCFRMDFPTIESRGVGPIYRKLSPSLLKVKMGLDLGFGPWPGFWTFQSGLTLDCFRLTLTWESPGLGQSIDLEVTSSFDQTLTWESFDVWLGSRFRPLPLTLTWFWPRLDLNVVQALGRELTW